MPRDVVEFQPNVPVRIALAYAVGRTVESRFGERIMFSLADGRVMFLDLGTAQKINELKPRPNQPFYLVKQHDGKKGSSPEWRAWRDEVGEQQNGTFVVPKEPERVSSAPAPVAAPSSSSPAAPPATHNGNGSSNGHSPIPNGWGTFLLSQTTALLDIYAAALRYAKEHHAGITADDVRSLMTTAYIAQTRRGGLNGE